MREEIVIRIPDRNGFVKISKQKVIESFLKKEVFHVYPNIYDAILKRLDDIECIQVYEDNVIRLHLKAKDHFNPKTSIIIEKTMHGETLRESLLELLQ